MVSGAGGDFWSGRSMSTKVSYCSVLATEPDIRFAAIVNFTFNLGAARLQASTLRRKRPAAPPFQDVS